MNEWAAVGSAYPDWLHDYSLALLAGMHSRMTRWLHIMPSPQDIEACDRQGIPQMMIGADTEGDVQGREWGIRSEIMRDVIIHNRNHPSIVFWEGANNRLCTEHLQDLITHRDRYDGRGYRRLLGGRSGGEWRGGMFFTDSGMATEYMRDESPRRWWDAWSPPYRHPDNSPIIENGGWNRNQDTMCRTQAAVYEKYYQNRMTILGGVQIFFADCNTPIKRGQDQFRRSGAVDAMRIVKDAYHVNRAMWSNTPELWTEGRPAVFLPGHWNYPEGTVKPMYVFTSPGIMAKPGRVFVAYDDANSNPPTVAGIIKFRKTGDRIVINGRPHTLHESDPMKAGDQMYLGANNWPEKPPEGVNAPVVFALPSTP
jgi:beta-galactosidase